MARLAKYQIEHIETQIKRAIDKRMNRWEEDNPEPYRPTKEDIQLEMLRNGKAKMKSEKELKERGSYYRTEIRNVFNFPGLNKEYEKQYKPYKEHQDAQIEVLQKLRKEGEEIISAAILQGAELAFENLKTFIERMENGN